MRGGLGLVMVGVVALTGCADSSGDEPRSLPSATAPSESPSAPPAASAVPSGPAAAKSASDFAKFFYAEVDRAFQARDPQLVASLTLPSCKTCQLYIDSIAETRDKNQRWEGGAVTVTFAVAPADTGDRARVDVGFDYAASILYDASGRILERTPAERGVEEQVDLVRQDGQWRVATIKRVVRK